MTRKLNQRAVLLVALCICLLLTGCPQDKYKKAAIAGRDFAVAVRTIQQTEMALACRPVSRDATIPTGCQTLIPPDQHQQFQAAFEQTARVGLEVDNIIRKGNTESEKGTLTQKDLQVVVNEALDATQRLLDSSNLITDARAKAAVISSVIAARAIVGNIQLALNGGHQ